MRRSSAKTYVDYISGPVKIKDALFMGDEISAKDMDFVASNKVTHIINTVVNKVPNLYQRLGIQYLSVNWTEREQNIFDKKNNAVNMIFQFVQQAMEQGESVLVHSINGKSRAGCVVLAYLMRKYCWSLQKSIDFICSKKATFKIRNSFLTQLEELEKRMIQTYNLSTNWNQHKDDEDLVMLNTFKNSKTATYDKSQVRKGKKKVSWGEKTVVGPNTKAPSQNILTSTIKYKQFLEHEGIRSLKPILKEDNQNQKYQKSEKNHESNKKRESIKEQQQVLAKSQVIGNIKGNVVNVVVNNFIMGNEKPTVRSSSTSGKEVSKKLESRSGSRLAPYQNIISSIRSPYDSNFISKVGQNTKFRKKDEPKYPNDRPQSVNLQDSLRQSKVSVNKPSYREELIGYTQNKSRYAWTNPRQNTNTSTNTNSIKYK